MSRRAEALCVVLAATAFALTAHRASRATSATFDEPLHLLAARLAARGELRLNPEHPALAKRVVGLALELGPATETDERIVERARTWIGQPSEGWPVAIEHLDRNRSTARAQLDRGRAAIALLGALAVVATWWAARTAFGALPACVALAACASEPNLLAHAGVVTYDVPALAFVAVTLAGAARLARPLPHASEHAATRPARADLALCGLGLGLALAAKHTSLALAPVVVVWVAWRHRAGAALAVTALAAAVVVLVHGGPSAYLDGARMMLDGSAFRPSGAYLLGAVHERAPWTYHLVVLATKLHPAFLALGLAGAWAARRTSPLVRLAVALATAQIALATASGAGLGVRYVLVAVPALALGAAAFAARSRRSLALAALAVTLQVVDTGVRFPRYLDYFGPHCRAAGEAGSIALDSNLDWGQDLPALARWQEAHPAYGRVYLAYCGTADARSYGVRVHGLPGFGGYDLAGIAPADEDAGTGPRVGLAVSANHAHGYLTPPGSFDVVQTATPIARAGSIWIYDATDDPALAAFPARALAVRGDPRAERELVRLLAHPHGLERARELALQLARGADRRDLARDVVARLLASPAARGLTSDERAALAGLYR